MGPISRAPMDETVVNRVRFRAWRRGFREADLILGPFADQHVRAMTSGQLELLEILLDQPDHDLYAWIIGAAPVPEEFDNAVMAQLRAFAASDAVTGLRGS